MLPDLVNNINHSNWCDLQGEELIVGPRHGAPITTIISITITTITTSISITTIISINTITTIISITTTISITTSYYYY